MTWLQTLNVVDPHHIEECEALFEAYFMQVAVVYGPAGWQGHAGSRRRLCAHTTQQQVQQDLSELVVQPCVAHVIWPARQPDVTDAASCGRY